MKTGTIKIVFILSLIITSCSFGQSIKPHTIGIVVSDIEKATDWYENILELNLYKEMEFIEYDSLKINFLRGEHFQLELMEKKTSFFINKYVSDYSLNNRPLIGFSKISFSVPDITAIYERTKKLGVHVVLGITEDKEFNSIYFIVKDLDGNLLQFIEQKNE
jgi:catechol 2,3-dioxygenase-like lactoylglutathione lyase family enzyme